MLQEGASRAPEQLVQRPWLTQEGAENSEESKAGEV